MAFDIDDEKEVTRRLFKAIHGNTRTKFNGLMSDAINELQSLRQRNEELDAELNDVTQVANSVEPMIYKIEYLENQILSQQITIVKMRDALNKIASESHNDLWQKSVAKEALSLQPSTAELAKHDEAVRVKERKAIEKLLIDANNKGKTWLDFIQAIRQRKTS